MVKAKWFTYSSIEIDRGGDDGEQLRVVSGLAVALALQVDSQLGVEFQTCLLVDLNDGREVDHFEAHRAVLAPGEAMSGELAKQWDVQLSGGNRNWKALNVEQALVVGGPHKAFKEVI